MAVDTRKEAVETFIQSTLKDHVLSEGMPRTSVDTQDAYAVVELLRSFLEKAEAQDAEITRLRAKVAKADALVEAVGALSGDLWSTNIPNALAAYREGSDT